MRKDKIRNFTLLVPSPLGLLSGVEKLARSSLKGVSNRALLACKHGRFASSFLPLSYRIFISLEKGEFVFQKSLSETQFKPDRVSCCTPNAIFNVLQSLFSLACVCKVVRKSRSWSVGVGTAQAPQVFAGRETDFYTPPVLGATALIAVQHQRCMKILRPKDPEFYTLLALNSSHGQHFPALEVYKNQSPYLQASKSK